MSAARMAPLSAQEEQDKWLAGASRTQRGTIEICTRNKRRRAERIFRDLVSTV
jgi:hypothetical protein|tara:strand:- start:18800 stop:18958 length:159 start_codon:yes stop_codon:yes gene_type:complete